MTNATVLPNGKQQYFTTPGVPAVGYKLATFAAGTTTPLTTWADALKVAANTNPVILDSRGEATIFWDGVYKVQLQDSTGAVIWTVDNLDASSKVGTLNDAATFGNFAADSGSLNDIVITVPAPTTFSYIPGVWFDVVMLNTTTSTSVTLNINGLGVKPVVTISGGALPSGALLASNIYRFIYDGSNFRVYSPSVFDGSLIINLNASALALGTIPSAVLPAFSSINGWSAAKHKAATTTRASTVVLADDPDLIFTSVPAGAYQIELLISPNNFTTNTQGIGLALRVGGAVTGSSYALYDGIANTATFAPALVSPATSNLNIVNISTSTVLDLIRVFATVKTTTTGDIALQWAQRSSSANFTAVQSGSMMKLTRLS